MRGLVLTSSTDPDRRAALAALFPDPAAARLAGTSDASLDGYDAIVIDGPGPDPATVTAAARAGAHIVLIGGQGQHPRGEYIVEVPPTGSHLTARAPDQVPLLDR